MNLATRLLGIPGPSGPVGDVLWTGSDHELIENARVAPTQDFVEDLIRIGYSDRAGAIVSHIPNAGLLDLIARSTSTKSWHDPIVKNTCTADATLDYIASLSSAASVKEAVSEEVQRRATRRTVASYQDTIAELASADVETLESWHASGMLVQALSECPTSARETVLSLLSVTRPEIADELYWGIVGVMDKSRAGYLTRSCAAWICQGQSLYADMARGVLADEPAYLARRGMSLAAQELLLRHEMLVLPRAGDKLPPQATSKEQLDMLQATGASALQLATLALNSRVPLTQEELTSYVTEAGTGTIAQFISGQFPRTPQPGSVKHILAKLSPEERLEVGTRLGDNCEDLPWFFEMVSEFPLSTVAKASLETIEAVRSHLDDRLGADPAAWEFAMTMSREWDSNLDSLVEASVAMDVLA